MKKLLSVAIVSLLSFSSLANAETTSDLRLVVGQDSVETQGKLSLPSNDSTVFSDNFNSEAIGVVLRTHFTEAWGTEIRYMTGGTESVSASDDEFAFDVDSTLFLSGLYKGPSLGRVVPYAKLGLGMVSMAMNNVDIKEPTFVAGLGLDFNVSESIVLGVEYEHFGEVEFNESTKGVQGQYDMSRVSLNLGVRF